jgi:hypothetical protein
MFISKEDETEYTCALQSFRNFSGVHPKIVLTDKKEAL